MTREATEHRRRERKAARRRKRIENGTRLRRFEGQGVPYAHAKEILARKRKRQERDRAVSPADVSSLDKGKGFFSKLKLSRWLRRTP